MITFIICAFIFFAGFSIASIDLQLTKLRDQLKDIKQLMELKEEHYGK